MRDAIFKCNGTLMTRIGQIRADFFQIDIRFDGTQVTPIEQMYADFLDRYRCDGMRMLANILIAKSFII